MNDKKLKYSPKRRFGNKGESLAVTFLMKQEYKILYRNYYKKVGEIDIIAEKDNIIHFLEVKTVTRETTSDVIHETNDIYKPEYKLNNQKLLHMKSAIRYFIADNNLYNHEIQIDLITVNFYKSRELPRIKFIENII